VLRVLVSVLLLGAVLVYVDVDQVAEALRTGDWGWFVGALVLMAVATVVGAVRWRLLLHYADIDVAHRQAIRVFAASLLLNLVLPTAIGGDAARAWLIGRESGRLVRAAAATLADKATAVLCLFVLAWIALAVDPDSVPRSVVAVLFWVTTSLAGALVVAVLVAAGVRPVVRRLPERLAAMIRETWATLRIWGGSARLIAGLIALGVLYQMLAVAALVLVARTVTGELSFALAAASGAIVVVATLVPISVGGLGVREGGFVLLLGEAGIDGADATVVSLLSVALIVLAGAAVMALAAAADLRAPGPKARAVPRQPSA
jgi:glycosyltransferase 2 family protein